MVLEKTLGSSLDCKEIKPVHPKENQCWIFFGRTDAEAPILCPPNAKSWLIGKDPDAGKDWRQEEKGMAEDEMVGWHHRLNGHEFEQALGDGEGQGSLACCRSWGHKESDTTELLNNNNKVYNSIMSKKCSHPNLKITWLLKNANHHLNLQWVITFLPVEGLATTSWELSLTTWFYKYEVTGPCNRCPSAHSAKSSGQRSGMRYSVLSEN